MSQEVLHWLYGRICIQSSICTEKLTENKWCYSKSALNQKYMTNDKLMKGGSKPLFRSASTKSASACNYTYHNNQPNWKEPVPKVANTWKFKPARFNMYRWGCGSASPSFNPAELGAKMCCFLWQGKNWVLLVTVYQSTNSAINKINVKNKTHYSDRWLLA